ncbi:MAG: CBS domain-containing protein [Candidatus Aenigmarchaeota archaeon]|nr:CBS domain-containing protein [Candidatus Aenigmarchaeota archaeon]
MISEIIKKPPVASPEDTFGKIAPRMKGILGLPVLDGKDYIGMVYLRDLVVRDFDTGTKISGFLKRPNKLEKNAAKEKLMEAFMEYPVLPVFEHGAYLGVIELNDFLKLLKPNGKACEYSVEAEVIPFESDIGTARNLLKANDAILVSENDELVGGIDLFSLARQIIPKEDNTLAVQKISEKSIQVRPVTEKFTAVTLETELSEALDLLGKKSYLVCEDYIITPKTILTGLRSEKEEGKNEVLELVGFDFANQGDGEVSAFEGAQVMKEIEMFANRTQKIFKPSAIKFHLQVSQKPGKDIYELYSKILTGGRVINAHAQGYKIIDLVQDIIEKLDTQLEKDCKPHEGYRRKARN